MKLLLVNLNHIGDMLFTLPTVDALLEAHPDAQIVHVVSRPTAPLVRDDSRFAKVVARSTCGVREWVAIAHDLRRRYRFDAALDFTRNSPGLGFMTWWSGAPVRIGFAGSRDTQPFFNHRVEYDERIHRIERNARLLGPLGVASGVPGPMRLDLSQSLRSRADESLASIGSRRIALCLSASVERNRWPVERFVQLAARLHCEHGIGAALVGGPDDAPLAERFLALARSPAVSFCGTVGIQESAALMAACALVISGDTGPLHLAISVGAPVVALYGSAEPHHTGPYRAVGEMIFHDLPCCGCSLAVPCPIGIRCMVEITVEEVYEAVVRVLLGPGKVIALPAARSRAT